VPFRVYEDGFTGMPQLPFMALLGLADETLRPIDKLVGQAILYAQHQFREDGAKAQALFIEELQDLLGAGRSTILNALARLEAAGVVEVSAPSGRGKSSRYQIAPTRAWRDQESVRRTLQRYGPFGRPTAPVKGSPNGDPFGSKGSPNVDGHKVTTTTPRQPYEGYALTLPSEPPSSSAVRPGQRARREGGRSLRRATDIEEAVRGMPPEFRLSQVGKAAG
jgi:DNA-binding transcriptional ArsR family regulator